MTRALAVILLALLATAARAADPLEGRWTTFEDGKPRAVVAIAIENGRATGRIVAFHPQPGESANPRCEKCPGALKDRPVVGLPILDVAREGGTGPWKGTVIDPDDGDTWRCVVTPDAKGERLVLRGYVLLPAFGREETWVRAH